MQIEGTWHPALAAPNNPPGSFNGVGRARNDSLSSQVRASREGGAYSVEQCPVESFSVTRTVTLTNSYFATAEIFWESLARPEGLAGAIGVIDQE